MKTFVIFGDIEFIEDDEHTALIHRVHHGGFYADGEIEAVAETNGGDWLAPHYYDGKITFTKFTKERDYEDN
jgi:hypothetical protein